MLFSYWLPPNALTNDELAERFQTSAWSAPQILRKTGVRVRHTAGDLNASDLAVEAGRRFFDEHGVSPNDIDFLLLCCQIPDHFTPSTVCMVQDRLGIPTSAGSLRIDFGCSGYIYGLLTAKGLIASGEAKNVLFITSEIHTRFVNARDRANLVILGDGASATLIREDDLRRIGRFSLGTDGSGARHLMIPAGAAAIPKSDETSVEREDENGNVTSLEDVNMNGVEVFSFTRRVVPELVRETLARNSLSMEDVDVFILHQANKMILDMMRDKLRIPKEKFVIDLEETGNTASSSIPIAIKRAMENGRSSIRPGAKVFLAGFGVGFSWGAVVVTI